MSEALNGWKKSIGGGKLRKSDVGKEVTLMGWVQRQRDHGGLIFADLRDRSGLVQVVFTPELGEYFHMAESLRSEFVIAIKGVVEARDADTVNPNMDTGEIEVYAKELKILNRSKTPPFFIDDKSEADEMVRLRYRYLDLRRPYMQEAMIMRHKTSMAIREFMDQNDFLEIETPVLCRSTPEGARDYLVPSRVQPGKFFALPQSPQLYKQTLMVAGMERYFQIARCFRDEDLRADRQPEFTQMDMEMSFVEADDVMDVAERMVAHVFKKILDVDVQLPMQRMPYHEAMSRYGSDKPDLRFGIELKDLSDIVADCGFKVFTSVVAAGGQVKAINANGCGKYSRKEIDELTAYAGIYGAKGLAWMIMDENGPRSSVVKFFSPEELTAIVERLEAKPGDLLLFVADKPSIVADSLGHLRQEIARREGLIDPKVFRFCWVTDFPLFEYNEEEKRFEAMHHPFTSPRDEDLQYLSSDPGRVCAKAYDMVLNGVELGGGSIRIHQHDVQALMFQKLGLSDEEAKEKFGYLMTAFDYGTPPHGGLAFGLDRMLMLMGNRDSIRDVIAFPKTQNASELYTNCPNTVDEKQLRELHIRSTVLPNK